MKKNQFIKLIICVVGGLLFSLGMCMCLLPEWNSFNLGVIIASIGGAVLLVMGIISILKNSKNAKPINWKLVGKISYGVLSALVLGAGMSLIMAFEQMLVGIIVGIVGIIMVLFLIPMFLGFKK